MTFGAAPPRASLAGTFHTLAFDRWPAEGVPFTAYAALYGGQGEGTIELLVTRLETERIVYRYRRWYAAPGPRTVHLEIKVRRCLFPAPGRYGLRLRFDGKDLTFRFLDVVARRDRP